VGRKIGRICGELLKSCTLELGGKNGAIVFEDADIDNAVASIIDGAFCKFIIFLITSKYGTKLLRYFETEASIRTFKCIAVDSW
jgi:hypothetical protein